MLFVAFFYINYYCKNSTLIISSPKQDLKDLPPKIKINRKILLSFVSYHNLNWMKFASTTNINCVFLSHVCLRFKRFWVSLFLNSHQSFLPNFQKKITMSFILDSAMFGLKTLFINLNGSVEFNRGHTHGLCVYLK